ncbi:MAG: ribulose-phosphate 3-epimerase [Chloroflexota bacterium]|nr:ribulose-phosphate 3-epimerase [Chloroflexota bacterium]
MARVLVAASILSADFGNLYRVVRKLERAGVDRIHLDVMDGNFVPNITFGPDVVAAVRRLTPLPIDVHLMISDPARYTAQFLKAGSDTITFHVEVDAPPDEKRETLGRIRAARRIAGLAVSPGTEVAAVQPFVDQLGIIMIMTVEPGFGGQRFLAETAPKIGEARRLLDGRPDALVHVDGGVSGETAAVVGRYGAQVCVVGSALFQRGRDTAREVQEVRREAGRQTVRAAVTG